MYQSTKHYHQEWAPSTIIKDGRPQSWYDHLPQSWRRPVVSLWYSPMGQKLIYYRSCPKAHIIIITLNVYCNQVLLLVIIVNLVNSFITNMSVLKKDIYFLKEFSSSLQWMVTKLRKIKSGGREFGNPHYWIFYWPPLTKAQKICQISRIFHFSTITIFAHMFIHHSLTLLCIPKNVLIWWMLTILLNR